MGGARNNSQPSILSFHPALPMALPLCVGERISCP